MNRPQRLSAAVLAVALTALLHAPPAAAHPGWGYQHSTEACADHPDWMAELPDYLRLSDISMVGTHDTYSDVYESWTAHTQRMPLTAQLQSGVRALDVRLTAESGGIFNPEPRLRIGHGIYRFGYFDDTLTDCCAFLGEHPGETILMRVMWMNLNAPADYRKLFKDYLTRSFCPGDTVGVYEKWFWHPDDSDDPFNPTLGDVRGKIVLLADTPLQGEGLIPGVPYGLEYGDDTMDIQDAYNMSTVWSMSWKWAGIRAHLDAAREDPSDTIYITYLSGSGGVFPHFVASGHTDPGTTSGHLIAPTQTWRAHYLAVRRRFWFFGWHYYWQYFYDGTNELTYKYLANGVTEPVGIVMADFPGPGLIERVIAVNDGLRRLNAPVAVAGGPYEGFEGSPVVFDAGGSHDPNGDAITYRWDVDADSLGVWETGWSGTPTTSYTWNDNFCGHDPGVFFFAHGDTVCTARLEVSDGQYVSGDQALVVIRNVAPIAALDAGTLPPGGCILPGQVVDFGAETYDPGCLDILEAAWDFGDGTVETEIVAEDLECPSSPIAFQAQHAFGEPGLFRVALTVGDSDGAAGADTLEVRVMTAPQAIACAGDFIHGLPAACFKPPAAKRQYALSEMLKAAGNALEAGNETGAVQILELAVRARADGQVDGLPNDDWLVDPAAQAALCGMLDELARYLRSTMARGFAEAVDTAGQGPPSAYGLSGNVPNPFNASTTIFISLPEAAEYRLGIYDVAGRNVRSYSGSGGPGTVPVTWDGRNDAGEMVPSGVYFCRLEAGDFVEARKMMFVQ